MKAFHSTDMTVQVDSREKSRAISGILAEFRRQDIDYFISKLFVGDYMSLDNPRLVVDRKQNLLELCTNVCQDHDRFRRELIRAREHGIHVIFLCEHGDDIKTMEDVIWWQNPRRFREVTDEATGEKTIIETKAITGERLYKILNTLNRKYDCEFRFCNKSQTGARILEILGGNNGN